MEPPDFGDSSSDSDSDDEGLVEEEPAPGPSPGQARKKRKKPGSAKKGKDGKSKGPPPPKKKRKEGGLIDDAAVESGDEDGDDDDDEIAAVSGCPRADTVCCGNKAHASTVGRTLPEYERTRFRACPVWGLQPTHDPDTSPKLYSCQRIHPSHPDPLPPSPLPSYRPKKQDGDDDNNDYERDGFVVGEDEAIEVAKKAAKGALEDSDSEDEDEGAAARRKKKIRKVRLVVCWRP
ncbi:hypothetical protein THAOC_06431 [Thalassiosira oceanica]|uniref:Uncharacterized protein n=1 Tax=Thalassiosira oceanica TaxID=159749 RepID=K0T2X0_THAOC|nr:hypothetical protein THAOC_06431 [Thalassiosira oceanica]|eukprot:EJK72080.1 hypothetical protein THAOC_06431 [Thalassiosira oceanica]